MNCIAEDKAGNLWIGTAFGLNHFDKKDRRFTTYTTKDGLPNNVIWGIIEDKNGIIWVSTNNGLSQFDPAAKKFRNFSIDDGLQSNTFHAKAAYRAADGEIYFGGENWI